MDEHDLADAEVVRRVVDDGIVAEPPELVGTVREAGLEEHAPAARGAERGASSAPCGSRPSSTSRRTTCTCACACIGPPITPNGPSSRPSCSSSPRDDRVERPPARREGVRVPRLDAEAGGAVLEHDARAPGEDAGAEVVERRLDQRHGVAVAVDRAEVGRAPLRPDGCLERGIRPEAPPKRLDVRERDRLLADRRPPPESSAALTASISPWRPSSSSSSTPSATSAAIPCPFGGARRPRRRGRRAAAARPNPSDAPPGRSRRASSAPRSPARPHPL